MDDLYRNGRCKRMVAQPRSKRPGAPDEGSAGGGLRRRKTAPKEGRPEIGRHRRRMAPGKDGARGGQR